MLNYLVNGLAHKATIISLSHSKVPLLHLHGMCSRETIIVIMGPARWQEVIECMNNSKCTRNEWLAIKFSLSANDYLCKDNIYKNVNTVWRSCPNNYACTWNVCIHPPKGTIYDYATSGICGLGGQYKTANFHRPIWKERELQFMINLWKPSSARITSVRLFLKCIL